MKIEKLQPRQIVYSVERRKMGNTTISETAVFAVRVIEVNLVEGYVWASWNGNAPQKFHGRSIAKWRANKPMLVSTGIRWRLATRAEIKVAKEQAAIDACQGTGVTIDGLDCCPKHRIPYERWPLQPPAGSGVQWRSGPTVKVCEACRRDQYSDPGDGK